MTEPTINCPKCGGEIKLTESLAAPLVESAKAQFQQQLQLKDAEVKRREDALAKEKLDLAKAKESVEEAVATRVKLERERISQEEQRKAKAALGIDLEQRAKELAELKEILKQKDDKLAEAQKAQAELMKKERELEDAKREMDLTVQKRITESLDAERQKAKKAAEEELGLKVLEKESTIQAMQKQIEDLRRRAEQGSQQLQGEVLELQLEAVLAAKFPHDRIEPVPKGEHGGDIIHRISLPTGVGCGAILWESKRTKNWSDGWLPKLRDDQRLSKADIAVIVSAVLPKSVDSFDQVDGVWVVHPRVVIPVATAIRDTLIQVQCTRQAGEGQQTKMELVYQYLTGPRFRQRIQAIVEKFSEMHEDLDRERKAMMKIWAKREAQLTSVIDSTAGMYGDLQGIAGRSLAEIDGLELDPGSATKQLQ